MSGTAKTKGAARCDECGSVFAVWMAPDGDIEPIGSRAGCPCGKSAFRVLQ
ncbi:hypothetical protein [Halomontanus rarus]|uniref:hypothetical protein n=1 Tax=Halomontanus rarus TaxID=3034020 RepID=UPI001A988687|nr:hypothetical protein [Halovivax sp. TS33]